MTLQAHPEGAVTRTLPVEAVESKDTLAGEIEYVQAIPSWLTLKVCPAIIITPLRALVDWLGAIL